MCRSPTSFASDNFVSIRFIRMMAHQKRLQYSFFFDGLREFFDPAIIYMFARLVAARVKKFDRHLFSAMDIETFRCRARIIAEQ